jgi:Tol biopolymer transport system component
LPEIVRLLLLLRQPAAKMSETTVVNGDTNNMRDVFVHDRQTKRIIRVSVASDEAQGNSRGVEPAISANGRYVVFNS